MPPHIAVGVNLATWERDRVLKRDIASKHGEKHYQHVGQDMPRLNQDG